MARFRPVPDPSGSLQPPGRIPPTAVGAATPEPEEEPSRERMSAKHGRTPLPLLLLQVAVALPVIGAEAAYRAIRQLARR